eukprot:364345_1
MRICLYNDTFGRQMNWDSFDMNCAKNGRQGVFDTEHADITVAVLDVLEGAAIWLRQDMTFTSDAEGTEFFFKSEDKMAMLTAGSYKKSEENVAFSF